MKKEINRKLLQLVLQTQEGMYGIKAMEELKNVQNSTNINACFLNFINYLYFPPKDDEILFQFGKSINEYLIILYRDSKIKNVKIANALFESIIHDFPNTQNTNLFDKYKTLLDASFGYKNAIKSNDKMILWNLSKILFEAYNEFLSGLFGYINICAKAAIGKSFNPSVLHNTYNSKIEEFNSLKLNFLFPVLSNLAKPELRNAITHSRVTFINDIDIIEYQVKIGNKFDNRKIDLIEFIGILSAATYLPIGYISALSSIYIIEYGSITDKLLLPDEVKSIFDIKDDLKKN